MNVYKLEVLVIDFGNIGPELVKSTLENARYPNHCISPEVKQITTKTVEWTDNHPLNQRDTADVAYQELFKS